MLAFGTSSRVKRNKPTTWDPRRRSSSSGVRDTTLDMSKNGSWLPVCHSCAHSANELPHVLRGPSHQVRLVS